MMKQSNIFMIFLLFAITAIITGCSRSSSENKSSDTSVTERSSPLVYQCESGQILHASYPSDSTAVVEYDDNKLQMTIAVSGSGARYVGGRLEWWTKGTGPGSEGTLFRHKSDGNTGEIVEQCIQNINTSEE